MTQSPFAQAAPRLVALGYRPLPIMPRAQAPGLYEAGRWRLAPDWGRYRDAALTPAELAELSAWPGANIGLCLGHEVQPGRIVIAVDIDATDADDCDALLRALPWPKMSKRGSKGQTNFYQAPADLCNQSFNRAGGERLLDLLVGDRAKQTVVPPSLHPKGMEYAWITGPVAADELTVFDHDSFLELKEALAGMGWDASAATKRETARAVYAQGAPETFWQEINRVALQRLPAWVHELNLYDLRPARDGFEAVNTWRESSTGRPLAERKRNLSIQPCGIQDFGTQETFSPIDLVCLAMACDHNRAALWLRERLGLNADQTGFALQPVAIAEPDAPPRAGAAFEELPAELTEPPGLIGALVRWQLETALRPQPTTALAAALSFMSAICGRQYAGPTNCALMLYVLGIAPTGTGKAEPLQAVQTLLLESGLTELLGPGEFSSQTALVNRIASNPMMLCAMDEFGSFFRRITRRNASSWERNISLTLRNIWGVHFGLMQGVEKADARAAQVLAPHLCIFGLTTPQEFYESLAGSDSENGTLNRFLVMETANIPTMQNIHTARDRRAPAELLWSIGKIWNANSSAGRASLAKWETPPVRIPWASDDVAAAWADYSEALNKQARENEGLTAFFGRTAEMALRIATLQALGRMGGPNGASVTAADLEYGRAVAHWAASTLRERSEDYMAETDHQRLCNEVRRALKSTAGRRMPHSQLLRRLKHKHRARDVGEAIQLLADAGELIIEIASRGPGRPAHIYTLTGA